MTLAQENTQQIKLIHHFLENSAARFPDKVALIHEDIRATYSEINSAANLLAQWLLQHGISKGDRVVILLENCFEYVVSYYGVLKTGAVVVPVSSDIKPGGLRPLLNELEPKAIISSSRFERLLVSSDLSCFNINHIILKSPKLNWTIPKSRVTNWGDIIRKDEVSNQNIEISETELSSIIYTSGSTGTPKGVMLSHKNIVSNTLSICQYLELSDKDSQMVVLPFFYVFGKSLLNSHFAVGGSVVINNKFAFPAVVLKQMAEEKVTGLSGVPSTYAYLLHRSPLEKYRDTLHHLRYCSQAGGHMAQTLKVKLRKILPKHTQIFIMYGATEASSRLSSLLPHQFTSKIGSIGLPISGVTLSVVDKNGRRLPKGQTGELVASGENIMLGYWNDPQSTAKVIDANGYHTGDIGYQDDDGFFYVTARKDNLIKVNGHRINPQEIEDVLQSTGLTIESAVFAVQDDFSGNKLFALATPKDNEFSTNSLMSLLEKKLPRHKMPSEVIPIRAIPKKANGKIDRTKCLELLAN